MRQEIQGLRAVAVFAVIIFHINADWLPGGFAGVDMFFVISGFIISSLILKAEKISWVDFYWGRFRRIVPAYMVMLAVTTVVVSIILLPTDLDYFLDSLKSALLFNSNNYYANFGDYFPLRYCKYRLLHF